jgi:hypothetical protein
VKCWQGCLAGVFGRGVWHWNCELLVQLQCVCSSSHNGLQGLHALCIPTRGAALSVPLLCSSQITSNVSVLGCL